MAANGTISVDGVLTTSSANVEGTVDVTHDGQFVVTGDLGLSADGTIEVGGTLTAGRIDSSGELVVQTNGALTTGQLDSGGELVVEPGGQVTATEGVRMASGGTSWVNGTLNTATATCDGTLWLGGVLNASQVTVQGEMTVMPNGQAIATTDVAVAAGGTLNVNGSVTAASVHNGGTLGGGGTITGPITVADGGIISPGDGIGVLTTGSIVFQDGASLEIEIAGNKSDQLNVTGELDLSSTRDFLPLTWLPSDSESKFGGDYIVAPYDTRISTFDSIGGGSDPYSIGQGYVKGVNYFSGRVTVSLHSLLDGDADLNGKVDFGDYMILEAAFGGPGGWKDGDFDFDGDIDFGDYMILEAAFGDRAGVESAAVNIPEPGSLVMLLGGVVGLLAYARRRKK